MSVITISAITCSLPCKRPSSTSSKICQLWACSTVSSSALHQAWLAMPLAWLTSETVTTIPGIVIWAGRINSSRWGCKLRQLARQTSLTLSLDSAAWLAVWLTRRCRQMVFLVYSVADPAALAGQAAVLRQSLDLAQALVQSCRQCQAITA